MQINLLGRENLLTEIKKLGFDPSQYCVIGGASLEIRGLRENKNDVDLLVTDSLYHEQENDHIRWTECALSENERVTLCLDDSYPCLELLPLSHFESTRSVTYDYIRRAEFIEGVPVIQLTDMLSWKKEANRDKDQKDIELITRWLSQ